MRFHKRFGSNVKDLSGVIDKKGRNLRGRVHPKLSEHRYIKHNKIGLESKKSHQISIISLLLAFHLQFIYSKKTKEFEEIYYK
jgi:hypothetical protein